MSAATSTNKRQRAKKLGITTGCLLAAGLAYAFIVQRLHVGIPCAFERITGLQCPGCGVSRMFLNLFQGNVGAAFACNPVTFCLLPVIVVMAGYLAYRYVKYGDQKLPKWVNIAVIIVLAVYIAWGIIRNLPGFVI